LISNEKRSSFLFIWHLDIFYPLTLKKHTIFPVIIPFSDFSWSAVSPRTSLSSSQCHQNPTTSFCGCTPNCGDG
jgi:hypothetical protein